VRTNKGEHVRPEAMSQFLICELPPSLAVQAGGAFHRTPSTRSTTRIFKMVVQWLTRVSSGLRVLPTTSARRRKPMSSTVAVMVESLEAKQLLSAAPVISNVETAVYSYTEGNAATPITSTLTVSDADSSTLAKATVQLDANYVNGQDVLAFANTGTITGGWNATTGSLTLTGDDTVANYQAALRSVTYQNLSNSPDIHIRRFNFVANDGSANSYSAYSYFYVISVKSIPVVSNLQTSVYNCTEGDSATAISSSLTLSDSDNAYFARATVQLDANYVNGQDMLAFANTATITGTWNASLGLMVLSGNDTVANYQAALRTVTYQNSSNDPDIHIRRFNVQVDDGVSNSYHAYRYFYIVAVDNRPATSNVQASAYSYTENDPATPISPTITVSDNDSAALVKATVQLDANYVNGQDVLAFANIGAITGSWNATTGTMTLTGTDTVANYQAALRTVTYQNLSESPDNHIRRFNIVVNDGALDSFTSYSYFNVTPVNDAPTITLPSPLLSILNTPLVVAGLSFGDVDAGTNNYTVTLSTAHGSLLLGLGVLGGLVGAQIVGNGTGSVTITASLPSLNATLGAITGLIYVPSPGYLGLDPISVSICDNAATGSGGPQTTTATLSAIVAL
jgi:hypothetical protein